METVIPRWEWRTFAADLGDAGRRFRALEPGKLQESDELYLLAPKSDANAKIRDGLMDLKLLEQTNADALEQWRPVMKGRFPLPIAEVRSVFEALRVAPPAADRETYTWDEFQAELTQPTRGVYVVPVHKRRQRYTITGCTGELTEVVADGHPTYTIAIEFEDPARVRLAIQEMGLAGWPNISYPRGLKRLLGMVR